MDFAAIVTNVVAAFAHVGGQALDAAQTTAEALLIALTILAALFQTSKLVTVYRSGTQLSGASVLGYDPLYDTRTRTLPASAPTASITVPLRVGDDYPPIPLSETIRLAFMLFTLLVITCAIVCQAVSNFMPRSDGSKHADGVARPLRRRNLDLVPQQPPSEFPTIQGLDFVEPPLVEVYIGNLLEDIPHSPSSPPNIAAPSILTATPEVREQVKQDVPVPSPVLVSNPTKLAKKERRKERRTAQTAVLLDPTPTQPSYSPEPGLTSSSLCDKVAEPAPSSSTQPNLAIRPLAAVESIASKATSASSLDVVVSAATETSPIPSPASTEASETPTEATAPSTTTDTPPSPTTPKAYTYSLPKASDALSETLPTQDEEAAEYDDDDGSSTVMAPEDARPSLDIEEDSSTVVEEDSSTQVKEDSSAVVETVATPNVVAQPVTHGLNLRGAGTGLVNPFATTCYVNSALQVLLHTPSVLESVLAHECSKLDFCLVCALKTTALKMYAKDGATFVPTEVIGNMSNFTKLLPYRQEDAEEFLQDVLEHIISTNPNPTPSFVEQIFGGQQRSRLTCCACGQSRDQRTAFKLLHIAVKTSVQQALAAMAAPESLEDVQCDECNRRGCHTETHTIHEGPRILGLQLKRFHFDNTKVSDRCDYPDILDIEPYMSTSDTHPSASTEHNNRPSTLYRLYAVVCHIGRTAQQGHYIAWVKTGEGKWAKMNDHSVTEADKPFACEEDGYMFFYERVDGADAEALSAQLKTSQAAAEWRRRTRQKLANIRGSTSGTGEGWTTAMAQKRAKKEQPKADNGSKEKREKHASSGKGKGERKGKKQTKTAR